MKKSNRFIVLGMLLLSTIVGLAGNWDRYVRRPIADVVTANLETLESSSVQYFFSASDFATRTTVVYRGEVRAMSERRSEFVDSYWGKMRGRPDVAALFRNEILCQEGDTEYWLPIQEQVLEYLKHEAENGSRLDLFVIWAGAINVEEPAEWVFLVNEFVVLKDKDAG